MWNPKQFVFAGLMLWVLAGACSSTPSPTPAISKVTPTRNLLSSPALSMDKLLIVHNDGKEAMISPHDKEAFLKLLDEKSSHLEFNEGREASELRSVQT